MNMKTHNVIQGSAEWHELRHKVDGTASEAAAVMGDDLRCSRNDLMMMRTYGLEREVSKFTQAFLFDKGHEAEAKARPIVEARLDEELYPITTSIEIEGMTLLASLDGMTLEGDVIWEHKLWNQTLAADVNAGQIPRRYIWQLEQQLLVTGADKVIFTVSDGSEQHLEEVVYTSDPHARQMLIEGWKQFLADLKDYTAPADLDPEPVGFRPTQLPTLRVEITGKVLATNVDKFRAEAGRVLASIKLDPSTDQEFADSEEAVKYCKDVESKITGALEHMLSQAGDIDAARKAVEDVREMFRQQRLRLESAITTRKKQIRVSMINEATEKLSDHVKALNNKIGSEYMPEIPADFVKAVRNKRTLKTCQDAVDDELAWGKREANAWAKRIQNNLKLVTDGFGDRMRLFPDLQQLVLKEPDDLQAVLMQRVAQAEAESVEQREPEQDSTPPWEPPEKTEGSTWSASKPPSDGLIIQVVAAHFDVNPTIAAAWVAAIGKRLNADTDTHNDEPAGKEGDAEINYPVRRNGKWYDCRGHIPFSDNVHAWNSKEGQPSVTKDYVFRKRRGVSRDSLSKYESGFTQEPQTITEEDPPSESMPSEPLDFVKAAAMIDDVQTLESLDAIWDTINRLFVGGDKSRAYLDKRLDEKRKRITEHLQQDCAAPTLREILDMVNEADTFDDLDACANRAMGLSKEDGATVSKAISERLGQIGLGTSESV